MSNVIIIFFFFTIYHVLHQYLVSPQAVVNTLATFLTSEGSLARQSDILVGGLCPGVEDPAGCTEGLPAFWNSIAALLWPAYYSPEVGSSKCHYWRMCSI